MSPVQTSALVRYNGGMDPMTTPQEKLQEVLEQEYFAATTPELIGEKVLARLRTTSLWGRSSESRLAYSQAFIQSYPSIEMGVGRASMVMPGGEQGQLSRVRVPRGRAATRALLGMLLGAKITWRPQAKTGDPADKKAVRKASNLLEYYWKQQHVEAVVTQWIDHGLRYAEGFVFAPWDLSRGPAIGGPGQLGGDLAFHVVPPWHVFRDENYTHASRCPWWVVRTFENRHDLLARYPTDIRGESTHGRLTASVKETQLLNDGSGLAKGSDVVPVFHFFHKRTPAMPAGRQSVFVNAGVVLEDSQLKYKTLPLLRFAPEELDDSPYGYTQVWDSHGVQEEMDGLESSIASNQLTFATQAISLVEGEKQAPDDVKGLKVFYRKPGPDTGPRPVQLTSTPKEVFEHLDRLKDAQRDIHGLNDVAMGDPDTAQMNAAAFSILAGAASQRNAPLQGNVLKAVAELGSHVVATVNAFLPAERKLALIGKSGAQEMALAKGELDPVDSVLVTIGSAMENSVAGRYQLAEIYKEMGAVKSPEQMQQVMETGRLEPVTDPLRAAAELIDHENELLATGQLPVVHFLDDALQHCLGHWSVLNANPAARESKEVVMATQQHIHEHYALFFGLPPGVDPHMDPQYPVRIRMLLGQQPPPVAGPAPGGPPPPGGGAPPQGPPNDANAVLQSPDTQPPRP